VGTARRAIASAQLPDAVQGSGYGVVPDRRVLIVEQVQSLIGNDYPNPQRYYPFRAAVRKNRSTGRRIHPPEFRLPPRHDSSAGPRREDQ